MSADRLAWCLGVFAILCLVGAITAAVIGSAKFDDKEKDEHREGGI